MAWDRAGVLFALLIIVGAVTFAATFLRRVPAVGT